MVLRVNDIITFTAPMIFLQAIKVNWSIFLKEYKKFPDIITSQQIYLT